MTSEQESRFSMFLVVRDCLLANQTITDTLPNCARYIAEMKSGIDQIQSIREQQEFNKTGIAQNKSQLKISLISQAIDVSRRVVAYASNINNTELLKEVSYTESDLKRSADTILNDRCLVIHDRAKQNIQELDNYGVTNLMINNLFNTMNAYNAAIPRPRLGIVDKKLATNQIAALIKNVDENLRKIDILVEMLKTTNIKFYNEYRYAKKIVQTGIGTLKIKGRVTDSVSGIGLKGAKVCFTAEKDLFTLIKKTAGKGGFNIKSIPDGTYTVTVSKAGYNDTIAQVRVTSGELTSVDIKLEKK